MSNSFSGTKAEEGVVPSKTIKGPIKVLGMIFGTIIIGTFVLFWWAAQVNHRAVNNQTLAANSGVEVSQAIPAPIEKVLDVSNDPQKIEVPYGYHIDVAWGYAPLDIRTNQHPEWKDAGNEYIDAGSQLRWLEFRLKPSKGGSAKVKYTFTRLDPKLVVSGS